MKNIQVFAATLPTITVLEETLMNAEGLLFTPLTDSQWSKLGLNPEQQLVSLENGYRIDFTFAGKDIPKPQIKEELEKVIDRYHNNALDSYATIAELVERAKDLQKEDSRISELGLSEEELAFYDILAAKKEIIKEDGPILFFFQQHNTKKFFS